MQKKQKRALFVWNVWSLLGNGYLLGKGKLKTRLHKLPVELLLRSTLSCYNAFVSSDWIERGISPSVPKLFCVFFFQDIFLNHSVCRFFFADREIAPFYAAFMMARVG